MVTTSPSHQTTEQLLARLTEQIARAIVLNPDQVQVNTASTEAQIYIDLTVDPSDVGRMIGKQGSVAQAMRTILYSVARRNGTYVKVEISYL